MANRRSARGGFGLILLATQIMQIGVDRIPPVTLITVAINILIYMGVIPNLPSVHGACTSNYHVVEKKQWLRLCTSSFYHLDDMHLYYNMISFIWKGITLERKMKSRKFLIVIALFSVLTQVVMLMLNKLFAEAFLNRQYLNTCAAGFSAVIFSLKVLTTFNSDANVNVMGLPLSVPSRYACWAELILIHFLVPNSSFTGHLAGILVGLLYTHGPLRKLIKGIKYVTTGAFLSGTHQHSYTRQAAPTGHRNHEESDENFAIQQAIQESLRNRNFAERSRGHTDGSGSSGHTYPTSPPSYGWNISDEPTTTNQNDRLYPSIPTTGRFETGNPPSAPPYNVGDSYNEPGGYPPYPTADPPYPSYPGTPPRPFDSGFGYPPPSSRPSEPHQSADEAMRDARLRKFDKSAK